MAEMQLPAWAYLWGAQLPQNDAPVAPVPAKKAATASRGPASVEPDFSAMIPPYLTEDPAAAMAAQNQAVNPDEAEPMPAMLAMPQSMPPEMSGIGGFLNPNAGIEKMQRQEYQKRANQAIAEQQQGLSELNKYIKGLEDKPNEINWAPLAAFIDSMVPNSKLTPVAQALAPMSQDQKEKLLFDLKNKLQLGRQALSKEQLDALASQIKMQQDDYRNNTMYQHYMNMAANANRRTDTSIGRLETQKDSQAQTAGNLFDNDPAVIKPTLARLNQIDLDMHTLKTAKVITPELMNEMGKGMATAIAGGKSSGLEETKMQTLQSAQKDFARLQQYIAGKPYQALTEEQKVYLDDVFSRLREGYGQMIAARAEQLRKGRTFKSNPHANAVMDQKVKEYKKLAKPPGPEVGEVIDGYRFKGGNPAEQSSWEKAD